MAGKIQIPVNLEDQVVLKRFLTNLVLNFNNNPLITGTAEEANAALSRAFGAGDSSFLDTLADIADVQTKIKTYVEQNVETLIKQNTQNIAMVAEQFGTFYNDALAASWYGLSVKAGGTVAGLEIGSLDPNTTTPGDESSYFRISADSFLVGRAYEDLSQEEKDYLAANNLPNFGTVYSAEGDPIPAFVIDWDSNTQQYNIFFNGRVSFNNINSVPDFAYSSELSDYVTKSTYITDINSLQNQIDGQIETWFYNGEPTLLNIPASGWTTNEEKNNHLGDLYYDKLTGYCYRFAYEDIEDNPDQGTIYSWIRIQDTDVTLALATASTAQETADGKITTFYTASTPTAEGNGDIWINSNTEIQKIWDGSTWVTLDAAKAINSGTTTINGSRITTGSITTDQLEMNTGWAGVIYNQGGSAASYSMKIDFTNGEIHIK
jgi:hypothetical protein